MHRSTILVSHRDGSAARHIRVTLGFPAGLTREAYTDDRGHVVVEHACTGRADVYVSGRNVGSFHAPGRTSVVI